MNNQDLFVDGVLNVTLVKGVIRLDLYSLSATTYNKDGHPQPEFRQRLVMNPQTLLAIQQDIQGAIAALRERGLMPMPPQPGGPQISVAVAAHHEALPTTQSAPAPTLTAQTEQPRPEPPPQPLIAPPSVEPAPAPRTPRSRNFPSTMGT